MEDNSFAQRLRKLRGKAGFTQEKLAELLNLSIMTIRRWEAGRVIPRMNEIKKLAEIFHIPENELLNGENEQSGSWALRIEVANDFKQEVIDLTQYVPCISSITTTPNGGFLTLGGDYSLWTDDELFKNLLSDLKKFRKTIIQNGIAQGGIKQGNVQQKGRRKKS